MGRRLSFEFRLSPVWIATAAILALVACTSAPRHGVTHVVRPGETVYRISRYYGVRPETLIRENDIRDVTKMAVGTRLWIPGTEKSRTSKTLAVSRSSPAALGDRVQARREADLTFAWPVSGRISSGYGWRGSRQHEGIDIPAGRGTPIRAAEAGRVIHSGGGLGAYGNVVIVKHSGRYSTVYAHNRVNLVRKGDFVEKGDVIARVGTTGNASGPHVHFEIRRNRRAQDPARYLP